MTFAEDINLHDMAFYAQHTEAQSYMNDSRQTMSYRLFKPRDFDPTKKYPLLLSFHGAGERGNDNEGQLTPWVAGWMAEEVQSKHPCIILMPQCPSGQQWVDTPWSKGSYEYSNIPISKPMKLAKEIFDKLLKEKFVDTSRIYVMGASMGGYGTWNFVMRYPELVAAAVPVCGAGDPSMAQTINRIPIWAFHGDNDTTVPPSGSQDMVNAIEKGGGRRIKITIYEGVDHGSYMKSWREKELIEWVFNQKKTDNKSDAGDGER
ncbi:MAG: prolyl oligopeptidase family serine peptidase [Verrucomicrobiae bacterium]